MKAIFLIAVFLNLLNSEEIRRVSIYGEDDRMNYYEADSVSKALASSTVALIKKSNLVRVNDSIYAVRNITFGSRFNLHSSEKFLNEPSVAHCSGFLASSNTVVTAAHCFSEIKCENTFVVFDYAVKRDGEMPLQISSENVFECKKIIKSEIDESDNGKDFAVLELDRKTDRTPLAVSRNFNLKENDNVFVIGYPSGLPVKITRMGSSKIRKINSNTFFTDLDTFRGNSGSPVFDEKTLKVVGIIKRGDRDFVYSSDNSNVYDPKYPQLYEPGSSYRVGQNEGFGEICVKTSVFASFLPQNDLERFLNSNPGAVRRTDERNGVRPAVYNPWTDSPQVVPAVYRPVPKPNPVIEI